MNEPLSQTYIRFLELSRALSENLPEPLTANQKVLLEAVVLAWHLEEPMSVQQAISIDNLGSPATLHKRLTILRQMGYVEEIAVDGDRRTKLLGPTQKALKYFAQLGEAMTRKPI